jgi:hypothetical protein
MHAGIDLERIYLAGCMHTTEHRIFTHPQQNHVSAITVMYEGFRDE